MSIETEPMKISPKYNVDDWKNLTLSTEKEWQKGIDIFENRINGRFLKVIRMIEGYEYSGFASLALDCLLIETLQQFRKGVAETPRGNSEKYFVRFLTETSFREFFDKEKAEKFYDQIRCGILHQAEIKKKSRVRIDRKVPLVRLTKDEKGLIINRKKFHKQLVEEFENYVSRLRENIPSNKRLRSNFKKKMDHICRVFRS